MSFFSFNAEIKSEWEWIPLLDFAYCLQMIVSDLKINDKHVDEAGRYNPIQTLDDIIKAPMSVVSDPRVQKR